ncbi:MAG: hypothetical protein V4692_03360, partial [Bdellovibrionota bacterium]
MQQLEVEPSFLIIPLGRSIQFLGKYGIPPYRYSLKIGTGTIDQNTGAFTTSATPGQVAIEVRDQENNTAIALMYVTPQFLVSPSAMHLTETSSQGFSALGGTAPYSYAIIDPMGGPQGVGTVDSLTGLFAAIKPGSEIIEVTDANNFKIRVSATVYARPQISPAAPAIPTDGRITFTTVGGTPPLKYSVIAGGACPVVDVDCSIVEATGVFRAPRSPGTVTVRVKDRSNFISDAVVTVYSPNVVAAGLGHNCFMNPMTGSVKCWGDNTYGQLGLEDVTSRGMVPNDMGPNLPVLRFGTYTAGPSNRPAKASYIAAGGSHNCAITELGVRCWGRNSFAQLGTGTLLNRGDEASEMEDFMLPTVLGVSSPTALSLSLGGRHSCAIVQYGATKAIRCWGDNNYGQTGLGAGAGVRGDAQQGAR